MLFAVSLVVLCSVVPNLGLPPPLATVVQTVRVARGSMVDLRPALTFNLALIAAQAATCRVTNIANGSSCGAIEPSIFDCSTYSGPILYQHFGCFSTKELATFMVSALPSNYSLPSRSLSIQPVQASSHSVEVTIGPPNRLIAAFRVDVMHDDARSEAVNLTVVFPRGMVGRCYYEVVSMWPVLSLPIAGRLEGTLNQLLPTGYVQSSPLTYWPHSWTTHSTDYILIKLYIHRRSLRNSYIILPFSVSPNDTRHQVLEMDRDTPIVIRQAVNTPVNFSSRGLEFSHPSLLRYTFPVLNTGSFRSIHSAATNVSYTTFTNHELLAGLVAFQPTYSLSLSFDIYYYNITNVAGVLVAMGEVGVLAKGVMGDLPSQRKKLPLVVAEGGTTAINEATIDFYKTRECDTTMQVLRSPIHGELVYQNGSGVGMDKIPFWVVRNTSLLLYRHSGDEELGDVIYWKVECSRDSLRVFMPVLVAAVDDALPSLRISSTLKAYRNWALPISPSSLQAVDPDSAHKDIHFIVHFKSGTLLKTSRHIGDLDNTSILFPLISFNSLVPIIRRDFKEVMNFSLLDLERQKVWYIPQESNGVDGLDRLQLTVKDSTNGESALIHTLFIEVSSLSPDRTLVISTSTQYPYILENKPLPLSSDGHMFLTPYFLYSRAPPSPPKDMRYVMQDPPWSGLLCFTHDSRCNESVRAFTQQDINYHRLVYHPSSSSRELSADHFTFLATVQGVPHIHPLIHTFNWTVVEQTTVLVEKQFWIKLGTEKPISPKFFHPFSFLLDSRNVTFHIREQLQYGDLMLRNDTHILFVKPSYFTLQDVLNRWLWYRHFHDRGSPPCNDELVFEAVSPLRNITGRLPIIFKRGEADLSVDVNPHVLKGLTEFTFSNKDFNVSSSFCPEFVTFNVASRPLLGTLRLKDHTHNTQRELQEGSTFTAKDIQTEALSYTFLRSEIEPNVGFTDEFIVRVSDPNSLWPKSNESEGGGRFTIIISPPPEAGLEVNFSTRHSLTWLPAHQTYGYALSAHDIQLLNTTLKPREVVVQVEKELTLGRLEKRGTVVSFFTVEDLQEDSIVYLKNSRRLAMFRESVKFGVYGYLPGYSRRAGLDQFLMEWATVELEESAAITVSEHQGTLQLSIRYQWVTRGTLYSGVLLVGTLQLSIRYQ